MLLVRLLDLLKAADQIIDVIGRYLNEVRIFVVVLVLRLAVEFRFHRSEGSVILLVRLSEQVDRGTSGRELPDER